MPRVSITISDGPNKGEWSAEYEFDLHLTGICYGGPCPSVCVPDAVLDLLEAKAREAYSADLAAARDEQVDLKRMQKEDGD